MQQPRTVSYTHLAKYGLDQPIYIQFFRYVGNMLRGDLGVSYNICLLYTSRCV